MSDHHGAARPETGVPSAAAHARNLSAVTSLDVRSPSVREVMMLVMSSPGADPYDEVTSADWTDRIDFDYEYKPDTDDPEMILLVGNCPRCQGEMTFEWPLFVPRLALRVQRVAPYRVTMICNCSHEHPGADQKSGCGAYWNVLVPPPA